MILRKLTFATLLVSAPAMWAQYSRTDMVKLAADRFDTVSKTLKLTPDQVAQIKPILQSKYIDMGQVKDVYKASTRSDTSKKEAKDSLKAIDTKYNGQINAILTPEQMKDWKRMQKEWKDDFTVPKAF